MPTELNSAFLPSLLADHGLSDDRIGFILAGRNHSETRCCTCCGPHRRSLAGPTNGADRRRSSSRALWLVPHHRVWLSTVIDGQCCPCGSDRATSAAGGCLSVGRVNASLLPIYGWVRGAGSAAFVAGTLLSGHLIKSFWTLLQHYREQRPVFPHGVLFTAYQRPARAVASCRCLVPGGLSVAVLYSGLPPTPLLVAALVVGSSRHERCAFAVISWRKAGFSGGTDQSVMVRVCRG